MSEIPVKPAPGQKPPGTKPEPAKKGNLILAIVVLVVLVAGGLIWAVSSNKKSSKPTTAAQAAKTSAAVSISSEGFNPANLKVTVGTTVTWTNNDTNPHRVASDPYPTNNGLPGFDSNDALNNSDQYSYTFDKAGTFTYHDQLHPDTITGTVIVSASDNE